MVDVVVVYLQALELDEQVEEVCTLVADCRVQTNNPVRQNRIHGLSSEIDCSLA